jgi:hypothetical protein
MDVLQAIDFQVSLLCIATQGNPPVPQIEELRKAAHAPNPGPAPLR